MTEQTQSIHTPGTSLLTASVQLGDNPPYHPVSNYPCIFFWCPGEHIAVRWFFSFPSFFSPEAPNIWFEGGGMHRRWQRRTQRRIWPGLDGVLKWAGSDGNIYFVIRVRLQFGRRCEKLCAKVAGKAGHWGFHPRIKRGAEWHQQTPPIAVTITAQSRACEIIRHFREKALKLKLTKTIQRRTPVRWDKVELPCDPNADIEGS